MTDENSIINMMKWLPLKPIPLPPLEFSALLCLSMERFEREDWSQDYYQEAGKETVNFLLKHLSFLTLMAENHLVSGQVYSAETCKDFGLNYTEGTFPIFPFEKIDLVLSGRGDHLMEHYMYQMALFDSESFYCSQFFGEAREFACASESDPTIFLSEYELINEARVFGANRELPEFLRNEINKTTEHLKGVLLERGHPIINYTLRDMYMPYNGPKDVYTMRFCLLLFLRDLAILETNKGELPKGYDKANEVLRDLLPVFDDELSDLPVDKVNKKIDNDILEMDRFAGQFSLDLQKLIGFLRFFLARNEGKISMDTAMHIDVATQYIMVSCGFVDQKMLSGQGTQIQDFWHDYPRPSPEDIAVRTRIEIMESFNKHKAEKLTAEFERVRGLRPEGYEEAVVYYFQDHKMIRNLRRSIFKSSRGCIDSTAVSRNEFLKIEARNNPGKFIELGLSDSDVQFIAKEGKIPINPETGKKYPITVDHTNDREIGGGNTSLNMDIMSESDNANKDALKKLQTMALTNKERGGWIITWVPENSLQEITNSDFFLSQMLFNGVN